MSGNFRMRVRGQAPFDNTPNAFAFDAQTGVGLGEEVSSNEITLSGMDSGASATISVTNGEYILNDGEPTSVPGLAANGDRIRAHRTAPVAYDTPADVVVTVGGVSGTFSIRTMVEPAASSAIMMRSTWTEYVDLGTALAAIHPLNFITLTVNGPVKARIWPDIVVSQGESMPCVHRELLNGNLRAETVGAALGAATWTITGKMGAGETGGTVSVTVEFDVTTAPRLTYTIGQRTPAQFGGYPIHEGLPGAASSWSIAGQSHTAGGGAFVIVNADNADPALATQRFLAFAGTYASNTRTVGTPPAGAGTMWVDLTNGTVTYRVTFDVNADELNIAPNAVQAAAGQMSQFWQVINSNTLTKHYGDRVIAEAGSYTNTGGSTSACYPRALTQRSGGPAQPTSPYANGYAPEDARNPGWFTIRPRRPQAAVIANTININFGVAPAYSAYLRLYDLDWHATGGVFTVNTTPADKNRHWMMVDHCKGKANLADKASCTNMFVVDGYTNGVAGSYTVVARDSQIVGCVGDNIDVDFINEGIYNTSDAAKKSWIAWNYTKNKKKSSDNAHPDHLQALLLGGGTANLLDSYPAGTVLDRPYVVGNIFALGEPSRNALGQGREGGHGIFCNDVKPDLLYRTYMAHNIVWDATPQGLWASNTTPDSKIYNNTLAMFWGVAPGAPGQTGTPYGRTNAILGQTGVGAQWKDCVVGAAAGLPGYSEYISIGRDEDPNNPGTYFPVTVTLTEDNLIAVGSAVEQAAAYADPANYTALKGVQSVLDRLAPKAGGPLTVAGGRARQVGAITPAVDFRRRIINVGTVFA